MPKPVYACPGSCEGVATEEQWRRGARTCGARTCELYGKPLQKRMQCEKCKEIYPANEEHQC